MPGQPPVVKPGLMKSKPKPAAPAKKPAGGAPVPGQAPSSPPQSSGALDLANEAKDIYAQMRKRIGGVRIQRAGAVNIGIPTDSVRTIIVQGDKDAGKTTVLAKWPVPEGTRRVFLSYDETTRDSLINYYGPSILDEVEVYEMVKPIVDENGRVIYPGFDPAKPSTAWPVIAQTLVMLEELDKEGNVGLIVSDHFQALYEQVATGLAYHEAGKIPGQDKLSLDEWGPRTGYMGIIEQKIRRVPVLGGTAAITGYAPEIREQFKEVPDNRPGRAGKMEPDPNNPDKMRPVMRRIVVKELKSPNWLKDNVKRNWLILVHLTSEETDQVDENGLAVQYYTAHVQKSKTPLFPKGAKRDITNKNLNVFYDEYVARMQAEREADELIPEPEDDAPPETPKQEPEQEATA